MKNRLLPFSPERCHVNEKSRPFFEGWYFKQSSEEVAFSVIPGVFRGDKKNNDYSFIQIIISEPAESQFIRYPADAFVCRSGMFELRIEDNYFSLDAVRLDIKQIGLYACFDYSDHVTLKKSLCSPSIMGPFGYVPGLQCNHGVLSLYHSVNGSLRYNGTEIGFKNKAGYIEKDWGSAFPDGWVWMQCGDKDVTLMCAIARIPVGKLHFTGLICVLRVNDKQYRFATYNGARVLNIRQNEGVLTAELSRGGYRLCIIAQSSRFSCLKAPAKTGMDRTVKECISAVYDVSLCRGTQTLYCGHFNNGGLEVHGLDKLIRNNLSTK